MNVLDLYLCEIRLIWPDIGIKKPPLTAEATNSNTIKSIL